MARSDHAGTQEAGRKAWAAVQSTTDDNAQAAEEIGDNLGEWANSLGRAFRGAVVLLTADELGYQASDEQCRVGSRDLGWWTRSVVTGCAS